MNHPEVEDQTAASAVPSSILTAAVFPPGHPEGLDHPEDKVQTSGCAAPILAAAVSLPVTLKG